MKFSKFEQAQLTKKPRICVRHAVTNYPGRIVKIKTAEARIGRQGMSLHDACTKPLTPQGKRR